MKNLFYNLYTFFNIRKIAFFGVLLLLLSSLLFFALKLSFEEDITKLIPQTAETKTLNKVLNNVDFSDKIIINVFANKNKSPDALTKYASKLIDSLELHCKDYIANVQGNFTNDDISETMGFMYENLPLFLSEEDYVTIKQKLTKDSITKLVASNYKTFISPSGIVAAKTIRKDPLGLVFKGLNKLKDLKIADNFEVYNGFLMTTDKKNILLFIKPKLPANETAANALFVTKLKNIVADLNEQYKGVITSEYYGATTIAVANANQIKRDIQYTVNIALTVLLLILIFFYRKLLVPFILFLPTVFGALIAIASLYFIREKVSAISLGIGSVLLGITLDYSLHILTHFKNNQNVKQLYKDITQPILMSSITTAIAFLCLLLLKSQALQDLGIFASISVISSSLFALFLIPILYKPSTKKTTKTNFIEKVASFNYDKSKWLIGGVFLLFVTSIFTYNRVTFNKDISKMNYMDALSLKAEKHLESILNLSSKSLYIVSYGNNIDSVLDANYKVTKILREAKKSKKILAFSAIGDMVLSEEKQQDKIAQWNSFWTDSTKQKIKTNLIKSGTAFGFKENTYKPFYALINNNYTPISLEKYGELKPLLTEEYIVNKEFKTVAALVKLEEGKKAALTSLLKDIPNTLLIDRKQVNETFLGGLKDNFSRLINYSFLAVLLILLLFYKNIALVLLTSFPVLLTWFITLGIMGLFGIEFNIFNVIVSTFIFGLGIDYSIFMTNALVKDYTYGTKEVNTYKVSIVLSVLTTVLGVGVLIFAKHPALKSISMLSLIGILTTVFVCFVIQPLVFRIFVKNRAKKGFKPIKVRALFHSIILLLFYSLGGMFLSLISILILPLIPVSKKTKYNWLHKTIAVLVQVVLYGNPFVKKKVINTENEDFSKPAIIIANHSSSLDTLTMGLITHKIVYLVNDWVYKSPVFGILTRVLGFYPVSNGVDDSVTHLEEKIAQGYSLMIFPEAKRSLSNKVGRFHKGAFFLQEKLKLDILPVYLHGNAEVMPKNDIIIHNGSLTVKVGKRIAYDDEKYGTNSRKRTLNISKSFKENLLKLRSEIEDENYFKDILLSNYTYKDTTILNLVAKDFEKNKKTYHYLNELLPLKTNIFHVGNDFGQLDILLVAKSMDRKITTYIKEVDKQIVARNCYTNTHRKVLYATALDNLQIQENDVLLISNLKALKVLDSIEISKFETIVLVNVSDYSEIENFKVIEKEGSVIHLKKIKSEG